MKKQKELLIIMPAYNEEKNIEAVLYELEKPEISSIADILVMNDASSDSTNWVFGRCGFSRYFLICSPTR